VIDCGVYSPAVVFLDVFEKFGVPITMDEARGPMGAHKRVHIRKVTELAAVRERWNAKHGRYPTDEDVEAMFQAFVPLQLECLRKRTELTRLIPGTLETVDELQKKRGLKIGSTTGFTSPMVTILKEAATQQGYTPDVYVSADEVPEARPGTRTPLHTNCTQQQLKRKDFALVRHRSLSSCVCVGSCSSPRVCQIPSWCG